MAAATKTAGAIDSGAAQCRAGGWGRVLLRWAGYCLGPAVDQPKPAYDVLGSLSFFVCEHGALLATLKRGCSKTDPGRA